MAATSHSAPALTPGGSWLTVATLRNGMKRSTISRRRADRARSKAFQVVMRSTIPHAKRAETVMV